MSPGESKHGRLESGIPIFLWHEQATAATAASLLRRLTADGFRYRGSPGQEAYSIICCATGTSELAVKRERPGLHGTLLVALLEECTVPPELADLPMFRVDLRDGYTHLVGMMRGEASYTSLEHLISQELDGLGAKKLSVAKALFMAALAMEAGPAIAAPLPSIQNPPSSATTHTRVIEDRQNDFTIRGRLDAGAGIGLETTTPFAQGAQTSTAGVVPVDRVAAQSEQLLRVALADYVSTDTPGYSLLISWLALIVSTSLLAGNAGRRDQPAVYLVVQPPSEKDLLLLRDRVSGRTGEFSYGVRPGDYFPTAPDHLDAAVRAQAKEALRAYGVPEADLESAVNSIEKMVTTAAAIQLAGRSVPDQEVPRLTFRPTFKPAGAAERDSRPALDRHPNAAPVHVAQDPLTRVQSFLVHGHEMDGVIAVKNYLQNELGMPQPVLLIEKPDESLPIQVKFEKYAVQADVAIVFLTPDDVGAKVGAPLQTRARQNAIGELFWFAGHFGPESGRVIILHRGDVEIPSDVAGIGRWDLNKGLDSVFLYLNRELRALIKRYDFKSKPGSR